MTTHSSQLVSSKFLSEAPRRRVLRIGHRGAAGHAPENTLAAIQKGIDIGVDFVEIDLRRTADGALIALHDATVNRTCNGKGRLDRLSLRDVQLLDAGHGEHVPSLGEVLTVAAGRAGVMLELKVSGIGQQAVEVTREFGWKDPVIYASFLHDEMRHVRSADPDAMVMVLFGKLPRTPVAHAIGYRPSHVGLRHDTASRRLVDEFHEQNLKVFVYTADRPRDIQRVISIGVDGVISNFPDRIGE